MNQIKLLKPLSMSSLEIAELVGKRHDHVMADIKNMLEQLNIQSPEFSGDYRDSKGRTYKCFNLDEELTLTLTSGYSIIQRNTIIKQWQTMRNALEVLKYSQQDTKAQIEAMAIMQRFLSPQDKQNNTPFIIANQVVNKLVGLVFGYDKAIPKKNMTLPMLELRHTILDHYVKLFEMGYSNSRIKSLLHEIHLNDYKRVA